MMKSRVDSPVVYPFAIYKANRESSKAAKGSIIHLNTLSQMCYQAYKDYDKDKIPRLLVCDEFAINGVGEPGLYEFHFDLDVVKKVENIDIQSLLSTDFRIGFFHRCDGEMELKTSISDLERMIYLHGDLLDQVDNFQENDSQESAIQWIHYKGSDDE